MFEASFLFIPLSPLLMAQRVIKDTFWTDPYIEDLSSDEKLIFLYLISNPLCNIAGLYEIKIKRISYETDIWKLEVNKILKKFTNDNKIFIFENWILLINFIKNQSVKNPNVITGINRVIQAVPSEFWDSLRAFRSLSEPLTYLTILNLTILNLTKDISKDISKSSIEDEQSSEVVVVHGNDTVNFFQELIKTTVEDLGFIYKPWPQERNRLHNIATAKIIGELSEKSNMTRESFVKSIIILANDLPAKWDFSWRGKVTNAVTWYKHYDKIMNYAIEHKKTLKKDTANMSDDEALAEAKERGLIK